MDLIDAWRGAEESGRNNAIRERLNLLKSGHGSQARGRNPLGHPRSGRHRRSSPSPLLFDAELLELCPHCRKPALEDADDPIANLIGRESGSVYEPTPTIDLILGTDDHLVGIAIHSERGARSPRSAA